MKIRLGIDMCIATGERRPTTVDDIREGVFVKEFTDKKEFLEYIDEQYEGQFSGEIEENFGKESFDELSEEELDEEIQSVVNFAEEKDPGFGDPNILFITAGNKVLMENAYGAEINPLTVTDEELQDAIIENDPDFDDEDDPWYPDDDEDEDFDEDDDLDEDLGKIL